MDNSICLQCSTKFSSYKKSKRKLKHGEKIYYYRKKNIKFCSHSCYHLFSKGKPLNGKHLHIAQMNMKKVVSMRQNNPEIKNKWIKKMREVCKGSKNYNWIEDRTKLSNQKGRNGYDDLIWKKSVYARDGYKCRISDQNCSGKIEAHHILPWRDYPELRYKINNGITLCHAHHPRKRAEEKRLAPEFQMLVSVSNSLNC